MKIKRVIPAMFILFSLIGCDKNEKTMADANLYCSTFPPEGGTVHGRVMTENNNHWEIVNDQASSWITNISQMTGKGSTEITLSTKMKNETKTEKVTYLSINNSPAQIFQAFQIQESDLLGTWDGENTSYTFKKDGKFDVKIRANGREIEFESNYEIKWNEVAGFIIYSIDETRMVTRNLDGKICGHFIKKGN